MVNQPSHRKKDRILLALDSGNKCLVLIVSEHFFSERREHFIVYIGHLLLSLPQRTAMIIYQISFHLKNFKLYERKLTSTFNLRDSSR